MDMAKTYNPSEFEKEIYEEWENNVKTYLTVKYELRAKYKDDQVAIDTYETYQKIKAFKTIQATHALLQLSFYIKASISRNTASGFSTIFRTLSAS